MADKEFPEWAKEYVDQFEHENVAIATMQKVGDPDTEFYVFKDQDNKILTMQTFFIGDFCYVNINNATIVKFDDLKDMCSIQSNNDAAIIKLKNGETYTIPNTPIVLLAQSLNALYDENDVPDTSYY